MAQSLSDDGEYEYITDPDIIERLNKAIMGAAWFTFEVDIEIDHEPLSDAPVLWTWRRMLERTREIWRRE